MMIRTLIWEIYILNVLGEELEFEADQSVPNQEKNGTVVDNVAGFELG